MTNRKTGPKESPRKVERGSMARLLLFMCAPLVLGCVTTETRTVPVPPAAAVAAAPARAWQALDPQGALAGYVVRFTEDAPGAAARGFFSVRNPYQQELGLVDGLGRSWRFEAHRDEPVWLGSGSVADATGRILGTPVTLAETPLAGLSPTTALEN